METFNFNELFLEKGYFTKSKDFGDLVFLNEGSFDLEGESMEFKTPSGEDFYIEFDIHVDGSIDEVDGYALIGNKDINIKQMFIGENKVELDNVSDVIKLIKSEIY